MAKGVSSPSRAFFLELVLNLVIFTFCAAICLQVFAQAKLASDRSEALSHLSIEAQTVAENFKAVGGDETRLAAAVGATQQDGVLCLYYDADFRRVESSEQAAYTITVAIDATQPVTTATILCDPGRNSRGSADEPLNPLFELKVAKYAGQGGGA